MEIILSNASKRYINQWIFKDLNHQFKDNCNTAIVGPNGSGKSTLIKILSGLEILSKGTLTYSNKGREIPIEDSFRQISYCAPYQELVEEFTLREILTFHQKFRKAPNFETIEGLAENIQLKSALDKKIIQFSSGMKQRVKLGLALHFEAMVTFLDEPTSNLDKNGIGWYESLIEKVKNNRSIIVASNQENEYAFCDQKLEMFLEK